MRGELAATCLSLLFVVASRSPVLAQEIVNPAEVRPGATEAAPEPTAGPAPAPAPSRPRSWEAPPVAVTGERLPALREEEPIGSYAQPRWTARRRFPESRIYVIPEGQLDFEYWLVPELPREGPAEIKQQFELEFGLPHHIQLDLYAVTHQEGNDGPFAWDEFKLEVRWALADWGRIPTNPTLYLEWVAISGEPDHIEGKILLGDQLTEGLHWGLNLVWEHQTGTPYENTYEVTAGISYALIDETLSVGIEEKFAMTDDETDRANFTDEWLVGPSVQYRPLPQMHIDFAPLFGLTRDSPDAKIILVVGWEF